jgi:hypothetical protein
VPALLRCIVTRTTHAHEARPSGKMLTDTARVSNALLMMFCTGVNVVFGSALGVVQIFCTEKMFVRMASKVGYTENKAHQKMGVPGSYEGSSMPQHASSGPRKPAQNESTRHAAQHGAGYRPQT